MPVFEGLIYQGRFRFFMQNLFSTEICFPKMRKISMMPQPTVVNAQLLPPTLFEPQTGNKVPN